MKLEKDEIKELIKEVSEEGLEVDKPEAKASEPSVTASVSSDEIASKVADAIVKAIQAQKGGSEKDAEYLKEKIYTPEEGLKAVKASAKGIEDLSDNEKIAEFFKALLHKNKSPEDYAVLKGLSEGTAADGGDLVPAPLFNEIARLLPDRAIMRKLARVIPMTSWTLKIPTQVSDPVAYWIGERVTKTTTSAEFSYVTLTANKLVARILLTEELNDDAIVAMVPYITELFAEAIAVAEDRAFFNGTGVGQPRGISIETLNATLNAGGTFNFDDVIALMNGVRQSVRNSPNCAFVAGNSVIQKLQILKDGNNDYIWRTGGLMEGQGVARLPDMVFNRPIYEQNDLPADELYFGDWSKYYIGDRKQLYVKTTDQNETAWTQDAIDIKAVERVDGRAALLTAFAKVQNC